MVRLNVEYTCDVKSPRTKAVTGYRIPKPFIDRLPRPTLFSARDAIVSFISYLYPRKFFPCASVHVVKLVMKMT
jgi:hypothetical protein